MFSLTDLIKNDLDQLIAIKHQLENEAKGKVEENFVVYEYHQNLITQKNDLINKIEQKSQKIEFYIIGISFIILTGLFVNEVYSTSFFRFTDSLNDMNFFQRIY